MLKRRSELDIVHDILKVSRRGARKTSIMYKANLSFTQLERYLKLLEERGLIRNSDAYYTTEKGRRFLESYGEMKKMLEEF